MTATDPSPPAADPTPDPDPWHTAGTPLWLRLLALWGLVSSAAFGGTLLAGVLLLLLSRTGFGLR